MQSFIDSHLQRIVASIDNPTLQKASHYALFPHGKRLRPSMLLSVSGETGIDIALAMELIHTYSLIHDDLPAMDNDDFRRGKPSLHKAFEESTAILTGDLLLTIAFQLISESAFPPSTVLHILSLVTHLIGSSGLIGGQVLDLAHRKQTPYEEVALKKTSSLFIASLVSGALIENLPPSDIELYREFGRTFGLLYQIQDDLEDKNTTFDTTVLSKRSTELLAHAHHLLQQLSIPNPFLKSLLR